jgi:hypothetical protein
VGEHRATLSAEHASLARSPTSPASARSEVEDGVEAWSTCRNGLDQQEHQPGQVVHSGRKSVMVLDVDEERRRISLDLKQCKQNRGRSSPRTSTVATRLRVRSSPSPISVCSSGCRQHRRPGAPVRSFWDVAGEACAIPEGSAGGSHGAVHRPGA